MLCEIAGCSRESVGTGQWIRFEDDGIHYYSLCEYHDWQCSTYNVMISLEGALITYPWPCRTCGRPREYFAYRLVQLAWVRLESVPRCHCSVIGSARLLRAVGCGIIVTRNGHKQRYEYWEE